MSWALRMHSAGGKEKKTCQAEERAQAMAQNIICPCSQGHVALYGLFRHSKLYAPVDTVQHDGPREGLSISVPPPHGSSPWLTLCLHFAVPCLAQK